MGELVKLGDCKRGDWVRLQSGELAIVGLSGDDDTGVDLYLDIYSEGIHRVLSSRSWVEPMCRAAEHEREEAPAADCHEKLREAQRRLRELEEERDKAQRTLAIVRDQRNYLIGACSDAEYDPTRDALVAAVLAWRIPLWGDSIEVLSSARGIIDAVKAYRAARPESADVE